MPKFRVWRRLTSGPALPRSGRRTRLKICPRRGTALADVAQISPPGWAVSGNAAPPPGVFSPCGSGVTQAAPTAGTLYRDYETRSTIDLRKYGAWVYATHQTTEVLCCAYAVDDGPVKLWAPGDPTPPEFIEAANNSNWVVSAFNDNFERQIERHIMNPRYGWPIIPLERHRCTQAQTLAAALPASLGMAALAVGLDHQKGNTRLMLQMAKPRRPRKNENPD